MSNIGFFADVFRGTHYGPLTKEQECLFMHEMQHVVFFQKRRHPSIHVPPMVVRDYCINSLILGDVMKHVKQ